MTEGLSPSRPKRTRGTRKRPKVKAYESEAPVGGMPVLNVSRETTCDLDAIIHFICGNWVIRCG